MKLINEFEYKLGLLEQETLLGIIVMLDCMGSFVEYTQNKMDEKDFKIVMKDSFSKLTTKRQKKLLEIIDEVIEDDVDSEHTKEEIRK